MKNLVLYILCLSALIQGGNAISQQKICADLKTYIGNVGLDFNGTYHDMENTSAFFNQKTLELGLEYLLGKHIGIGCHVIGQGADLNYNTRLGLALNNGDYVKISCKSSIQVQAISGNLEFRLPIKGGKVEWSISPAYCFGKVNPYEDLSDFSYLEPEISIDGDSTKKRYSSASVESGFSFHLSPKIALNTFLGFKHCFKPLYESTFNLQSGNANGFARIGSKLSGFYLGASLSVALISLKKKEKKDHFIPEYNDKKEITAIDGRKIHFEHQITVHSDSLTVQVWDFGKEDGDKISLFINEQQLLKKYKLKRVKKELPLFLKPGLNKLIVYAHNLGKDPPNTASVVIIDGNEKHVVSIESTLGECGAVAIYRAP
jgi:hypothetical protein